MIHHLHGELVGAQPSHAVVEVQGVGYEVLISGHSFSRLPPPGSQVHLLTHLVVREDAHTLYGFLTSTERDLFRLLIHTVSGIGPRIALSILGAMPPEQFADAIRSGDLSRLSKISGIGRKTAERLVVELKDKLGSLATLPPTGPSTPQSPPPGSSADPALADAALALVQLGRKPADADAAVRAARAVLGPSADVDALVRAALRRPVEPAA